MRAACLTCLIYIASARSVYRQPNTQKRKTKINKQKKGRRFVVGVMNSGEVVLEQSRSSLNDRDIKAKPR